ncbi:MAG: hypothetical protein ABMA02_15850 [Saprospiraceae bacterium]
MKNKQALNDELDESAPFLKGFRGQADGYRVPEGYFESVEDSVYRQIEAIGATRRPPVRKPAPSMWQVMQGLWHPRTAMALAAVFAVVFAAWWFLGPAATNKPDDLYAQISAEDAEAYLLTNLMELEPEQLAAALPVEQTSSVLLEHADENTAEEPINLTPGEIDHLLRDLSDDELDQLIL